MKPNSLSKQLTHTLLEEINQNIQSFLTSDRSQQAVGDFLASQLDKHGARIFNSIVWLLLISFVSLLVLSIVIATLIMLLRKCCCVVTATRDRDVSLLHLQEQ